MLGRSAVARREAETSRELQPLRRVFWSVARCVPGSDRGQVGERVVGVRGLGFGLLAVREHRGRVAVVAEVGQQTVESRPARVVVDRECAERLEREHSELGALDPASFRHEERLGDQIGASGLACGVRRAQRSSRPRP